MPVYEWPGQFEAVFVVTVVDNSLLRVSDSLHVNVNEWLAVICK